jgi:hypothetical protein
MAKRLADYLAATGDDPAAFAARVGATAEQVRELLSGEGSADLALARRIVEASGGALRLNDLLGAGSNLADLASYRDDAPLDEERLRPLIAGILKFVAKDEPRLADVRLLTRAAETVADVYAALARVTTKTGPDRLAQALLPVLQEILAEFAVPYRPEVLAQAANTASRRYCGRVR